MSEHPSWFHGHPTWPLYVPIDRSRSSTRLVSSNRICIRPQTMLSTCLPSITALCFLSPPMLWASPFCDRRMLAGIAPSTLAQYVYIHQGRLIYSNHFTNEASDSKQLYAINGLLFDRGSRDCWCDLHGSGIFYRYCCAWNACRKQNRVPNDRHHRSG